MQNDIETHGELEGGPPAFFTAAEKWDEWTDSRFGCQKF
jgi:hypothetical protein